jgi:CHAT domain-containing protein
VWDAVRGASVVYVLAQGPLQTIPFEGLVVGERDGGPRHWADDGPPVAYEPSASILAWLRSRPVGRGAGPDLVAVADPVFARERAAALRPAAGPEEIPAPRAVLRGSIDLPRVPGTGVEVDAVSQAVRNWLGEAARLRTLRRTDASEATLFAVATGPRFLHLATHGLVDETEAASFSALALTVPAAPAPGDDGFLTLADLFHRWRGKLAGTELVVLSACESARGEAQRDEAMFALPWGFLFAGARSVVGSLWQVDDQSTAFLMAEMYRRLPRGDRADPLRALAEARRATKAKHPHPHFWAPFVFTGAVDR